MIETNGNNMKIKKKLLIHIFILLLFIPVTASANRLIQERGIYPNQSAEYVRTLNRSASMEADAAFYNPAGLAFLKDEGLYLMVSGQTYYANKTHTMDYYSIEVGDSPAQMTYHTKDSFKGNLPSEYFATTTAPILPDLDIIYKGDEWAVYFDVSVMQAAPDMKFPIGLAIIDWGNLAEQETSLFGKGSVFEAYNSDAEATRNEMLIGAAIGGSYQVTDWFSVALGGRYISAKGAMNIQVKNTSCTVDGTTEFKPDWDIDTTYEGHGGSLITGCHFNLEKSDTKWLRPFNIGLKFEYHLPIVMTKTNNSFSVPTSIEASGSLNLFKDGTPATDMTYGSGDGEETFTFQYPMQFNLGISYNILENLRVETSTEITLRQDRDLSGEEEDYKPFGYKIGVAIEWGFMENVRGSLGYLYNDFGLKEETRDAADMMLPSHAFGGGISIDVSKKLTFTFGAYYEYYVPTNLYTTEFTDVSGPTDHYLYKEFNENRFSVAWGITYLFSGDSSTKNDKKKS